MKTICVRCGSNDILHKFEEDYINRICSYGCEHCNLIYNIHIGNGSFSFTSYELHFDKKLNIKKYNGFLPPKENYVLFWEKDICRFGTTWDIMINTTYNKLPYLPFDITKEKLKIYLMFL